ncbi:MAG: transposase [Bacilli bacterium]|nr:transposase [Bacilli bacterium]
MSQFQNTSCLFRVYPNQTQEQKLLYSFLVSKRIWNDLLLQENRRREEGSAPTPCDLLRLQSKRYVVKEDCKGGDPIAYGEVGANLYRAIRRHLLAPNQCRYPKPKVIHATTGSYARSNEDGAISYQDGKLYLPYLEHLKIRGLSPIPFGARIISVVIRKKASGKYVASITYSVRAKAPDPASFTPVGKTVGLDYSPARLFVASDPDLQITKEEVAANRADVRKIKKTDSKIRSCTHLSNNQKKLRLKEGILMEKIANRRKDLIEKYSTKISKEYDAVFIEDIDVKEMADRHSPYRFGRIIAQSAWGLFIKRLSQKCKQRQKRLIKVSRYYPSSQLCSSCGYRQQIPLEKRIYTCPKCGLQISRDFNAALNIQKEGLRLLKTAH